MRNKIVNLKSKISLQESSDEKAFKFGHPVLNLVSNKCYVKHGMMALFIKEHLNTLKDVHVILYPEMTTKEVIGARDFTITECYASGMKYRTNVLEKKFELLEGTTSYAKGVFFGDAMWLTSYSL